MHLKAYQRESATEETILFLFQTAGRACELALCRSFGAVCFEHNTSVVIPCRPTALTALPLQMRFICAPLEQQWQHQTPHGNADFMSFFLFFFSVAKKLRSSINIFISVRALRSFQERMNWFSCWPPRCLCRSEMGISVSVLWLKSIFKSISNVFLKAELIG